MQFQSEYDVSEIITAGGMPLLLKDGLAYTPNNSYGGTFCSRFKFYNFIDELKNIGAEKYLIRHAPWLNENNKFPKEQMIFSRNTVARDLLEIIKFGDGTRSSIKKNIESGCNCIHIAGKNILYTDVFLFRKLYIDTMIRNNSEECYQYDADYFDRMFDAITPNIDMFVITKDNEWIAAATFIHDDKTVHYHFSGCNLNYSNFYPMERLISEACHYYQQQGKELIHFGGGLKQNDSLFQFKNKFGNMTLEYFISRGTV